MSPLACSLLALAALLAAADAIMPNPCSIRKYDMRLLKTHYNLPRIHFPPGGGHVTVHHRCGPVGAKPVIYKVTACNQHVGGYPPSISKVDDNSLRINCRDGCDAGGYVDIVENCYEIY